MAEQTYEGRTPSRPAGRPGSYAAAAVMLGVVFVALLWVPSYAKLTPTLGGIPFFYWYSILWLLLNAVLQFGAYQLMVAGPRRRRARETRS